jgi:ATP-dependent exoDNAse (exonuclease V) alpha subunit
VADYRLAAQMISRADGRNAVAAAAYRAGATLANDRNGQTYDYTRKGGVLHTEIIAPAHAPDWAQDRAQLWNAVERSETRINSQVAREIQLSLPHELTDAQRKELVTEFVRDNFVVQGMVADIAIHAPSRHGDERNVHAHVLLTTRAMTPDGFAEKRREWNAKEHLYAWRENWAAAQNRHLTQALGQKAPKVTHQSYAEQGLEKIPGHHLGPGATAMERRRERSERGDLNRASRAANECVQEARARQDTLQRQFSPPVNRSVAEISVDLISVRQQLEAQLEGHQQRLARALQEQKGLRVTINSIERGVLAPFDQEVKQATRDLDLARQRAGIDASPRVIMNWFKDPAGQLWQSAKRSMDVDAAAGKLAAAQKKRHSAQAWLKSEPGMKHTLDRYNRDQPRLRELRTDERKAWRNVAQVSRQLKITKTMEKTFTALRQTGLAGTVSVPQKSLDVRSFLRFLQTGLRDRVQMLSPQQKRTLAQTIETGRPPLSRGR